MPEKTLQNALKLRALLSHRMIGLILQSISEEIVDMVK
jgi:hypothetical protein